MKIPLPSLSKQQRFVFEQSTKEAIRVLKENLKAQCYGEQSEIDESQYSRAHLNEENADWEPPHPDIVGSYFRQFQSAFEEFNTDKKLADLLGVSSDRRIRGFKSGERKVPFPVWRKFLVMTGRAPQSVIKVYGYFGSDEDVSHLEAELNDSE